jgi:hypothetical protein
VPRSSRSILTAFVALACAVAASLTPGARADEPRQSATAHAVASASAAASGDPSQVVGATPAPPSEAPAAPPHEPAPAHEPAAAPSAAATAASSAPAPSASASSAPASSALPAASASATPASSATPKAPSATAELRLGNTRVGVLAAADARTAEARVASAERAIVDAADDDGTPEVRVDSEGDHAIVRLGARVLVDLGPDDARASGEPSATTYAAKIGPAARDAVSRARSQSAAVMVVLGFALLVISALLAVFLARKVAQLADRTRAWIAEHPDRIPALRVRSIEVIRPASLRAALGIGLGATRALSHIAIGYGWVLVALSLFAPTRPYAERLTGFVFGPLYALLVRAVGSVPLLVVAAVAVIALVVLVRFVGLFFESVARGETVLEWLPADLAGPTSLIARVGVTLVFAIGASPLVTGDDGALARAGAVALGAIGLSLVPLLSCAVVGATVVYGRRLRFGEVAEVGGRRGRVLAVTLLEVVLEDEDAGEIRVPHLLGLVHPIRVLGLEPEVVALVTLAPEAAGDGEAREVLRDAAATIGTSPRVELVAFDADSARYRVSVRSSAPDARGELHEVLAATLRAADVPLGRPSRTRARVAS